MQVRKTIDKEFPSLGKQIQAAREADPRSVTQLAAAIGFTAAYWYKIEGENVQVLPLETLRKIESVLGVDLNVSFD